MKESVLRLRVSEHEIFVTGLRFLTTQANPGVLIVDRNYLDLLTFGARKFIHKILTRLHVKRYRNGTGISI
jgi:hypothetical protein